MGCENPSGNLQSQMEDAMIEASMEYEEDHGWPFPSIEDQTQHSDVGALADRIEQHYRSRGATDIDISTMYPDTDSDPPAGPPPVSLIILENH